MSLSIPWSKHESVIDHLSCAVGDVGGWIPGSSFMVVVSDDPINSGALYGTVDYENEDTGEEALTDFVVAVETFKELEEFIKGLAVNRFPQFRVTAPVLVAAIPNDNEPLY